MACRSNSFALSQLSNFQFVLPSTASMSSQFGAEFEGCGTVGSVELLGGSSDPSRPFVPVAPPVNSLDIIRMIVSPRPSHSPWADVVRHDITIVREFGAADAAFTALGNDLSIDQLAHFSIGAELTISSRMKRIFNSAYTQLSNCLRFRNYFPAAAETRAMDWADLVATKSHEVSPDCHSSVWGCLGKAKSAFHGMGESVVGRVGLIIIALLIVNRGFSQQFESGAVLWELGRNLWNASERSVGPIEDGCEIR
jgi:hypothetical protein